MVETAVKRAECQGEGLQEEEQVGKGAGIGNRAQVPRS